MVLIKLLKNVNGVRVAHQGLSHLVILHALSLHRRRGKIDRPCHCIERLMKLIELLARRAVVQLHCTLLLPICIDLVQSLVQMDDVSSEFLG